MGGFFSGRKGWCRKEGSQHDIDIRWMQRQGWLYDGCAGSIRWSIRGEETGSIGYRVSADILTLDYRHRENSAEWEQVESQI